MVGSDAERRNVAIETEFAALPSVQGDRVHLQQVLLNLVVNGMDAMADTHVAQRRLTIRTARADAGDVEVSLSDAGHGISADQLTRLFESFFTTKRDGMGVGLSIAGSIVETHGGRTRAENNSGGGASLRFTIPIPVHAARARRGSIAAQGFT
jgi:signal transduction histidine kinase